MEQRTTENVVRHTLVSGFLRKMEYFRGILILTTNRVETFDEAILSRVHLKLRYGALNEDARVAIWKLFVEKAITPAGPAQLGEQDLQPIARKSLNGRQVSKCPSMTLLLIDYRSRTTLAHALARRKKERLSVLHLQTVLKGEEAFNRDFHHTERSASIFV